MDSGAGGHVALSRSTGHADLLLSLCVLVFLSGAHIWWQLLKFCFFCEDLWPEPGPLRCLSLCASAVFCRQNPFTAVTLFSTLSVFWCTVGFQKTGVTSLSFSGLSGDGCWLLAGLPGSHWAVSSSRMVFMLSLSQQRFLSFLYCKGKRQAFGMVGRWISFSYWKISSTRGQEQLVQTSWICWYDRDGGTPVLSTELAFALHAEQQQASTSPKGTARSVQGGGWPRFTLQLGNYCHHLGLCLKAWGWGWGTSGLCGNLGRVAEIQDQQEQTGRLAF